ncbi:monooxygenase [Colletotrichum phormii]|uniref:Monooxygenase n=1 Tax=Colletotrichum phormii TaxID=359342 RepID=A0AAI9ZJ84_9PEZI|nr:monooxygenase [Colletotrichum phormii]KAK1625228.1 monooxygenase [Colletotrichum phormii]
MNGFANSAGCLALLAALISETVALPVQDAPLRVEWRSLSSAAKAGYISAVKCLDGLPSKIGLETSRYNDFPYVHAQLNNEIHFVAQFLPWHRYFVHIYETALRDECKYTGPMTYWDWTLDSEDMSKSPVFSNDTTAGFGGNGLNGGWVAPTRPNPLTMCVIDGAFANFTVSYYTTTTLSHCLNRGFNDGIGVDAGPYEGGLYSPEKISGIIETSGNFSTFATALENGPHGAIHSAVGGDLFPSTSPNDPLFFLHHVQIDRLWWLWQQADLTSRALDFSGQRNLPSGEADTRPASLNDTLPTLGLAVDIPIQQVMSTTTDLLYYKY